MTHKVLTATLAGRGALVAAALALLALAVLSVASVVYAQDPPPAPTDLTASASSGGITLSWTAPEESGVTGYQVLRRLSAEEWDWSKAVYVDDTGDTDTSYTDTGVQAGEEYHYRVKARYGDKIGRWSNGVNVRAAEDAPPPTPEPTPEPSLSDDATLSRLELSGIPFAFDPATYTYDVEVGYGIEQTVITAQTSHAGASHEVAMVWAEEYEDGVVTLAVGANTIVLGVTAEDGETTAYYTVIVTRAEPLSDDATLSNLELSGIPFAFDPATYSYDVEVGYGIEQTVITAQTGHAGASYEAAMVWAEAYEEGVVTLAVGANTIVLEVTAEDGETTAYYTVIVTRAEEPEVVFVPQPPPAALVSSRQVSCDAIWCATLTVGHDSSGTTELFGWASGGFIPGGALSDDKFDYEGDTYTVSQIRVLDSPGTSLELFIGTPGTDDIESQAIRNKLSLHVGNDAFNLGQGTYTDVQKKIAWSSSVPTWADQDTVQLKMYAKPEFKRAIVDGNTLTITFNTPLDAASEPAGSAFTVTVAGSAVSVTNVDVSGETATLTLGSPASFGQAATVSYAKPASGPLQNPAGTDAPNFSGETVYNHTPSAPCDALWCAVMRVVEDPEGTPPYYGWFGQGVLGGDLSDVDFTHDGHTYELDRIYSANQIRALYLLFSDTEYGDIDNPATRNKLKLYFDYGVLSLGEGTYTSSLKRITFRNVPLTWSAGDVLELSIDDRPALESAVVVGDTMTLTFDRDLDGTSEPAPGAFSLLVDSLFVANAFSDVAISGKTVTLTLARAVNFDQVVTVNYNPPTANPLRGDGDRREVAEFVNRAVTNDTCPALWCANLTVDEQTGSFGWSSGPEFAQAVLTDDRFNFAGNEYQLDEIAFRDSDNRLTLSFSGFNAGDIDTEDTRLRLAVDIDGAVLNLGEGTYNNSVSKTISWTQDVAWTDGQTIQLQIVEVLGPILSISPKASPIKEARSAKATFTVTRSHLTSGYTTANLGWSKTGDYLDCSPRCRPHHDAVEYDSDGNSIGQLPTSPVFAPGETTKTITFNIHDDNDYELPGSITMFLRPPTTPGNEYAIDPDGQSATVEVHSHGRRGGPLGFFGDVFPPILAHMEVPSGVPEADGQYQVSLHLRMVPFIRSGRQTWATNVINEDTETPPSFSFTISTRGQTATSPTDYGALSYGVLFQQRKCSPPSVVNDCWRWDGHTWLNTHTVDVTSAITSNNRPAIVSDSDWENHERLNMVIERSPGLSSSIRFDESVPRELPLWIMDTGPAGDPGLTANWTPTGVDLAWDNVPNPPAGSKWQFTVYRRNLSGGESAPYEMVDGAGSIGVKATTDSEEEVNGIGDLNLVEYVVEGIAYAGGTKVDMWASAQAALPPPRRAGQERQHGRGVPLRRRRPRPSHRAGAGPERHRLHRSELAGARAGAGHRLQGVPQRDRHPRGGPQGRLRGHLRRVRREHAHLHGRRGNLSLRVRVPDHRHQHRRHAHRRGWQQQCRAHLQTHLQLTAAVARRRDGDVGPGRRRRLQRHPQMAQVLRRHRIRRPPLALQRDPRGHQRLRRPGPAPER